MDFPDNESLASVFTDWSEQQENLEIDDDSDFVIRQPLLQKLLEDDLSHAKISQEDWLDLLNSKDFSLKSLQWMDELSQACTDLLWDNVLTDTEDYFRMIEIV